MILIQKFSLNKIIILSKIQPMEKTNLNYYRRKTKKKLLDTKREKE